VFKFEDKEVNFTLNLSASLRINFGKGLLQVV
jgi:hypothetical protein